jgi:hypothetical protein
MVDLFFENVLNAVSASVCSLVVYELYLAPINFSSKSERSL